jgi:hypothetical protein
VELDARKKGWVCQSCGGENGGGHGISSKWVFPNKEICHYVGGGGPPTQLKKKYRVPVDFSEIGSPLAASVEDDDEGKPEI